MFCKFKFLLLEFVFICLHGLFYINTCIHFVREQDPNAKPEDLNAQRAKLASKLASFDTVPAEHRAYWQLASTVVSMTAVELILL